MIQVTTNRGQATYPPVIFGLREVYMRKFSIAAAVLTLATVFWASVVMSSAERSPAFYGAASGSVLPTTTLEPAW